MTSETAAPDGARDQPRPALGRRPWFALDRRARSLRRFFLAIAGASVPPIGHQRPEPVLRLAAEDWRSPPVAIAVTLRQRLLGIRHGRGCALVMRGSRVHGRGIMNTIMVTGIDDHGVALATLPLEPGRHARLPGAAWVLELPVGQCEPPEGAQLRWERASACAGSPPT